MDIGVVVGVYGVVLAAPVLLVGIRVPLVTGGHTMPLSGMMASAIYYVVGMTTIRAG